MIFFKLLNEKKVNYFNKKIFIRYFFLLQNEQLLSCCVEKILISLRNNFRVVHFAVKKKYLKF